MWASQRADGELSVLESALLAAHLGRCADCRSFARATAEVCAVLRAACLEHPVPVRKAAAARRSR
jgi:predicted anti-sigma-YlaC factor YlaD